MTFRDRAQAGGLLAQKLQGMKLADPVVVAIPRGGVVVGAQVAKVLKCPLDLVIVRKVGHPHNSEYALCVVAEDGEKLCMEGEMESVDRKWLEEAIAEQRAEAKRRRLKYLSGGDLKRLEGKTAILVDDGVATGLTFEMAVEELKHRGAARIVAALPVAPKEFAERLGLKVDEVVVLEAAEDFLGSVGAYYERFDQVEDEEVVRLMAEQDWEKKD